MLTKKKGGVRDKRSKELRRGWWPVWRQLGKGGKDGTGLVLQKEKFALRSKPGAFPNITLVCQVSDLVRVLERLNVRDG